MYASRRVVQVDLLRKQVYDLIHEDLLAGEFSPGARLTEIELARRYSVSRTPVREALFQLSSTGMIHSAERGYVVPADTAQTATDRDEMRALIDPRLVHHASVKGTKAQVRMLEKLHQQQCASHESSDLNAFVRASVQFRTVLREMCHNELLVRCSQFLDNQTQISRRTSFKDLAFRVSEINYNAAILKRVAGQDAKDGGSAMPHFPDIGGRADGLPFRIPEALPERIAS